MLQLTTQFVHLKPNFSRLGQYEEWRGTFDPQNHVEVNYLRDNKSTTAPIERSNSNSTSNLLDKLISTQPSTNDDLKNMVNRVLFTNSKQTIIVDSGMDNL